MRRWFLAATAVFALGIGAVASGQPVAAAAPTTRVSALTLLGQLPVREEVSGYSRSQFGSGWATIRGCSVRAWVLVSEAQVRPSIGSRCRLTGGKWASSYDGKTLWWSGSLDIDHMVPLAEAWESGARYWSPTSRLLFANDLGYRYSLNAVTSSLNRSKGASEPLVWMPPSRSYQCTYLASWVAVKWRWNLAVDSVEKFQMNRKLQACGAAGVLIERPSRAPVTAAPATRPPVTPVRPPVTTVRPPATSGNDPRFGTCGEAKGAGYGPYRRGVDPEYAWYRDGDSDGIVCE